MTGEELGERLGLHPRAITTSSTRWSRCGFLERDGDGADGPLPQHRRDARPSSTSQPDLHRRHPRDGQRAPLPLLGRSHRGAADRQAAERDQAHRQADVRGALQPTRRGSSSSWTRWRASRAATSRRSPRSSTSRRYETRLRRRRRDRAAVASILAAAPPAPAVHQLRPPGRRADRREGDRGRRARGSGQGAVAATSSPTRFPQADVITMGMILHDWNLDRKMHLIRAAYDALPEGGAFIVDREPHRRRPARERVRADDVAEHADRVRRRLRLHRRRLRGLVPRGRLPRRRDHAPRRPGERRQSPTSRAVRLGRKVDWAFCVPSRPVMRGPAAPADTR